MSKKKKKGNPEGTIDRSPEVEESEESLEGIALTPLEIVILMHEDLGSLIFSLSDLDPIDKEVGEACRNVRRELTRLEKLLRKESSS